MSESSSPISKIRAMATPKRLMIAAGVLVALFVANAMFNHGGKQPKYVTSEVTRGDLTVTVSATGKLQPLDQVDIGAEVSGRVETVLVDFNDHVKAGQVLATINTDALKAQLAQTQASLTSSRATVDQSYAKVQQYRTLLKVDAVSSLEAAAAEADYARAAASVQSAEAEIANTRTSLTKAIVRAPIDGVVLNRAVSKGQTVASSFQTPVLFTLASDLSKMLLNVDIDEADIGVVKEGQSATFEVDAFPGDRFEAKLVSLRNSSKTENGVVSYTGVLLVDNSKGLLRPGMTATASILTAQASNVLLAPNGALRFTPAEAVASEQSAAPAPARPAESGQAPGRVWVLEGGKAVARDLMIGRSDGRVTQVMSGPIAAGDKVVIDIATPTRGQAAPPS